MAGQSQEDRGGVQRWPAQASAAMATRMKSSILIVYILRMVILMGGSEEVESSRIPVGGEVGVRVDQVDIKVEQVGVMVDQVDIKVEQVVVMVQQVVKKLPPGSHVVLASTDTNIVHSILRQVTEGPVGGMVVVDTHSLYDQDTASRDHLLQGLWGEARHTCRALILVCVSSDLTNTFKLLDASELWLWPDTRVMVVGGRAHVKSLLHHNSFRNTIHLIYLALAYAIPNSRQEQTTYRRINQATTGGSVWMYRRCLYCKDGYAGVELIRQWSLTQSTHHWNPFSDKLSNFMGHKLKIVVLPYFPYIAYDKGSGPPEAPLLPRDSLNIRMLDAIAQRLNFSYELQEPLDMQWGVPLSEGNWTGVVGTLQHERADLSLDLTPTASRLAVISFCRIYTDDPLVIVSLKPGPLPRHLALKGPFTGKLWVLVIVCTSVFGVVLWLLQKTWAWVSGGRGFTLSSALLYSWGALLEADPTHTPTNLSGRVLIGLWLVCCLVVTNGYRSSLVAHLSIQGKTSPINTYQDLLKQRGWSWGVRALQGTVFLYFNQTTDPAIYDIYKKAKLPPMLRPRYSTAEALQLILAGRFAYITFKTDTMMEFASSGDSPFYTSSTQYPMFAGGSWGFRQGAPFLHNIDKMMARIIEGGLVDYWLVELTKKYEENSKAKMSGEKTISSQGEDARMVLSLDHLQSAFYLLFLGQGAALLTLLLELLLSSTSPSC